MYRWIGNCNCGKGFALETNFHEKRCECGLLITLGYGKRNTGRIYINDKKTERIAVFIDVEPNAPYGDLITLMTVEDFLELCKDGVFMDYDGHGKYSNGSFMACNERIKPSNALAGKLDPKFSHIVWFNR